MDFNFSTLAETSFVNNSSNYLKPYDIYLVKLTKIARESIKGSKDPNASYDVVNLEFTGENGIFTTNLFVPNRKEDFERGENPNTHKPSPSAWERFYMTLLQVMEVLNPKAANKFKDLAKSGKIKDINVFLEFVTKALSSDNLGEAYLKLVGRNNNGTIYSTLPGSCYIDQEGKVKPLNFIHSDKSHLNFSSYENQKADEYRNAKPTSMDNESFDVNTSSGDINVDDLINDL